MIRRLEVGVQMLLVDICSQPSRQKGRFLRWLCAYDTTSIRLLTYVSLPTYAWFFRDVANFWKDGSLPHAVTLRTTADSQRI